MAIKKFDGKTSLYIQELKKELSFLIGEMEVSIDYPEYDFDNPFNDKLTARLKQIRNKINQTIELSQTSRMIFEGIKIAILGKA
nr:hypothetical protein [Mycoplasmopsis bovis]